MSEKYQGWTNHATWCVNLWLSNNEGDYHYWREAAQDAADNTEADHYETHADNAARYLAARMCIEIEEAAPEHVSPGTMWHDLLTGYLDDVNWREIAATWLEDVEFEPEEAEA